MESVLLSVDVLAGILFVGPIAVATSLFPRYAPAGRTAHGSLAAAVELLHRIARREACSRCRSFRLNARHSITLTVGIFNLLWAIVVVLMIVRPGSD